MRTTKIREEFVADQNITNYLFELSYGSTRADIVSKINNKITTYEIKAEGDNFSKLKRQISEYFEFSSYVYIIIPRMYYESLLRFLDKNSIKQVGIIVYIDKTDKIHFKEVEKAKKIKICNFHPQKAIKNVPKYFINEFKSDLANLTSIQMENKLGKSKLKNLWFKYIENKQSKIN